MIERPLPSLMKMCRAAILLLALASCAGPSPGPAPGPSPKASLQVSAGLDPLAPDPIEGELGLFVIRLANASKDRLIVLKEMSAPEGGNAVTWSAAPSRPLRYDPRHDAYIPAATTTGVGAEPLNVGLLLPGEAIQFRPRIRLLGFPRRYVLQYFDYSADEAAELVYFEERKDGRVSYRRKPAAEVAAMVPAMLAQGATPPGTHRSIVFPHGDSILEEPRRLEVVLDVKASPRPFRLAHALQKAGLAAADAVESTYSVRFNGWAVRTASAAWLVTPAGVTPLPPITRFELFFQHLDLTETGDAMQVDFFGGSDGRFPDTRIVLTREGGRTRRIGFVGRDDIPAFLKRVHQEGFEIDTMPRPGRLVVSVRRRSWQLGEALAKAGLTRAQVLEAHYSTWLGGWAVRTKSDTWFVGDDDPALLPSITKFGVLFPGLDTIEPGGSTRVEFAAGTESHFPGIRTERSGGLALAGVAREDFLDFLATARAKGLTLEPRVEIDRLVTRVHP